MSSLKKDGKRTTKVGSGGAAFGARGHTNQQDNIQTNNKKTKVFS